MSTSVSNTTPAAQKLDQRIIRLITEHQTELSAYIRSIMPKVSGKQDVLQETNIVLWEKRGDLLNTDEFRPWAYRVAYFQTLAHLKKLKRQKTVCLEPDVLDQIANEHAFIGTAEHRNEELDALSDCLAKLSEEDNQLVSFHYKKHGGLKEYAERINMSLGRIKHALIRIRSNLKTCINRQLEINS